jgi:hypothetical protein
MLVFAIHMVFFVSETTYLSHIARLENDVAVKDGNHTTPYLSSALNVFPTGGGASKLYHEKLCPRFMQHLSRQCVPLTEQRLNYAKKSESGVDLAY